MSRQECINYETALLYGYRLADRKLERGYISRRINCGKQPVMTVKTGKRKGDYFVRLPCWFSTRYIIRQYLLPPEQ